MTERSARGLTEQSTEFDEESTGFDQAAKSEQSSQAAVLYQRRTNNRGLFSTNTVLYAFDPA